MTCFEVQSVSRVHTAAAAETGFGGEHALRRIKPNSTARSNATMDHAPLESSIFHHVTGGSTPSAASGLPHTVYDTVKAS